MPIRLTPTETQPEQPETDAPVITEASPEPIPPASTNGHGTPPPSLVYSRYQELDHTDLLHIIEELEDNRNWASLREKLWIALIVHLLLVWFLFYGSKHHFFNVVRVITPQQELEEHPKQLTYLNMPPDLQKILKPKPTNIISNQNHRAETRHPTLKPKTIQQLQAMRPAGPPKLAAPPMPRQAPMRATPRHGPPQRAQARPTPPAQPLPENMHAKLTAPPQAPVPNFRTGPSNPNQQLQNAMRQAMQGSQGQYGGDDGMNAPLQHPGMSGGVEVLSDTMGVDFGPYIQRVIYDTKRAWYPIIPEEAQPPLNKQGTVFIRFKIMRDGTVADMHLDGPSGDVALDRAAWGGILGASPYPPLPSAFKGKYLELRFEFLYNQAPPGEN